MLVDGLVPSSSYPSKPKCSRVQQSISFCRAAVNTGLSSLISGLLFCIITGAKLLQENKH